MGVVVKRYINILIIIITFPYSTCISSFLAAASLLLCSLLKSFLVLVYVILCNIVNVAQRTFEVVKNRDHANILYIYRQERRLRARASPETSTCEVPRDVSRKL